MRHRLSIVVALLLCAAPAVAQDKKEPPYTEQKAELGYTLTSGNAKAQSLSALYDYLHVMTTGEFHVDGNAIRNETTDRIFVGVDGNNQPIFDERTNVAAEAYGASAKYRHNLGQRYFAYGLGAWARILQAGIDDRWRGGGGLGVKLIEPQPHKLDVELGLEYTDESYIDGSSANFASVRAFVDYDYAISEHSTFSSDVELLQSLEDSDDLRINWPTSITASVSSKIALKLTYLVLYDHQPASLVVAPGPPPVLDVRKEFDGIFTTSIVVNW